MEEVAVSVADEGVEPFVVGVEGIGVDTEVVGVVAIIRTTSKFSL